MEKNLENKVIEIDINGIKKRVAQIEGTAIYVLGTSEPFANPAGTTMMQRVLSVTVQPLKEDSKRMRFKFKGDSIVDSGDHITFGVILEDEGKEVTDALYIAKWSAAGIHSHNIYSRVDYMIGYIPSDEVKERIVMW